MISRITLSNWRSHERTELEFGRGTNIIIGIMGAGKSSVLEGMCYALFGTFPAHNSKKLKISDVIRSRPEMKAEASVELQFTAPDGAAYTVMRSIAREKSVSSAELRKDGKLIESKPERVTDYVQKLLRVDYELFTRAMFSEQNRIDHLLLMPAGDRKREIDQLLGIDRFEKVRANLRGVVNRLKAESEATKNALAGQKPDKMKSDLEKMQKEQEELKHKYATGEKHLKVLDAERRGASERMKAAEAKRSKWAELDRSKARHEQTLSDLLREISKTEKGVEKGAAKAEESLTTAVMDMNKVENDMKDALSSVGHASEHLGSVRANLDKLHEATARNEKLRKSLEALTEGKTVDALRGGHAHAREKLDKLTKAMAEAEAALSLAEDAERALTKAGAACPVCDAPLDDSKKKELSERRRREISKAKVLAVSLKLETGAKSKELSGLWDNFEKAQDLHSKILAIDDSELKKLSAERERLEQLLRMSMKTADELKAKRGELEKQIRRLEMESSAFKEMEERKERAKEAQKEIARIASELSKLDFKEEEAQKAQAELRKHEAEWAALDKDLGHWNAALSKLGGDIGELRLRLQEYDSQSARIAGWEKRAEELEVLGNALVEVQAGLRNELIDAINAAMSSIWPAVYPYGDYSKVRLSADASGYELELGDGDNWSAAEGLASGGERACACLALRIAFARVLVPNLSWLILDEPTHNLDDEAVRTLALALRDEIPAIVDQVFVITHEEGLKEAASGQVYLLDRNKRQREATVARRLSAA